MSTGSLPFLSRVCTHVQPYSARVLAWCGHRKTMKKIQNPRDAASLAPPPPTKNTPTALRPRAEILPPQRHQIQQCVQFHTPDSKTTHVSNPRLEIKNTLQITENKQQHPFLIDSNFAEIGPQRSPAPPKSPAPQYQLRPPVLPRPVRLSPKIPAHRSYHCPRKNARRCGMLRSAAKRTGRNRMADEIPTTRNQK